MLGKGWRYGDDDGTWVVKSLAGRTATKVASMGQHSVKGKRRK